MRQLLALAAACLAITFACGKPTEPQLPPEEEQPLPPEKAPEQVASPVGTTGGEVKTTTGGGVSIPAGALGAETTITVAETPSAPPPDNTSTVSTPLTLGPEGQTFSVPVTVTVVVDPAKLPAGKTINSVIVFTAPAGTTNYTALTTKVVDATHVSAETTHFSTFVGGTTGTCQVTCGNGAKQDCSTNGSCTTTYGCQCNAYCKDDGSEAVTATCAKNPDGSGGTCPPPPTDQHSYSVQCDGQGAATCKCLKDGAVVGSAVTTDCSATADSIFNAYTACGFPGAFKPYVPPDAGNPPTGCGSGATCPAGQVCMNGQCVASGDSDGGAFKCRSDSDCSAGGRCDAATGTCSTGCSSNGGCPAGFVCATTGQCAPDCVAGNPCSPGMLCNTTTKSCEFAPRDGGSGGCKSDADCGAGGKCDLASGACSATSGCTSNAQCGPGGMCVGTACAADCVNGNPCGPGSTCDTATRRCVSAPTDGGPGGCQSDTDCGGGKCDLATGKCMPSGGGCIDNGGCPPGGACVNGSCMPDCVTGNPCGPNAICNTTTKSCEPAPMDGGTSGCGPCPSGTICDPASGKCVSSGGGCTGNSACPPGGACVSGSCIQDCVSGNPCGSGMVCDTSTRRCMPAPSDGGTSGCGPCPSGTTCDPATGTCKPSGSTGCTDNTQCPPGGACVSNACVQDCVNGNPCGSGMVCETSTKRCVPIPPDGGTGCNCPAGMTCDASGKCI